MFRPPKQDWVFILSPQSCFGGLNLVGAHPSTGIGPPTGCPRYVFPPSVVWAPR